MHLKLEMIKYKLPSATPTVNSTRGKHTEMTRQYFELYNFHTTLSMLQCQEVLVKVSVNVLPISFDKVSVSAILS